VYEPNGRRAVAGLFSDTALSRVAVQAEVPSLVGGIRRSPARSQRAHTGLADEYKAILEPFGKFLVNLSFINKHQRSHLKSPSRQIPYLHSSTYTAMSSKATVQPLSFPEESGIKFGATVSNVDIEDLTGKNR
jgi:hypothetical protein